MKIYILIKPHDYSSADIEIFHSKEGAELSRTLAQFNKEINSEYWGIQEYDVL